MVRFLVENGAELNARTNDGRAALMQAARVGDLEIVRFLVENGAELNAQDKYGESALIKAVRIDALEVVRFLVDQGADTKRPRLIAARRP